MARKKITDGVINVTDEEAVSSITVEEDEFENSEDDELEEESEEVEDISDQEWMNMYVPDSLRMQAQALVESEAFGYKTVAKLLSRVAYHARHKAEWMKGVEMHQQHINNAVHALDKAFNPRGPRTSSQRIGALTAYSSFSNETLQHIAAEKGLSYDGLGREGLVDLLVSTQFND